MCASDATEIPADKNNAITATVNNAERELQTLMSKTNSRVCSVASKIYYEIMIMTDYDTKMDKIETTHSIKSA